MTKRELITHLKACKVPDTAEVYFAIPDEEEILEPCCLQAETIRPETAHDDDCTAFIRVSLCDPAFEAQCQSGDNVPGDRPLTPEGALFPHPLERQ